MNAKSTSKIPRCYDSHVHLVPTGELDFTTDLHHLRGPHEVRDLKFASKRGDWLVGFGWDATDWLVPPHRRFLDDVFGSSPVSLSRVDGHCLWLSTESLKRVGLWLSRPTSNEDAKQHSLVRFIEFAEDGWPTGLVYEKAVDHVLELFPAWSGKNLKMLAQRGIEYFRKAGFTHLRDMQGGRDLWQALAELSDDKSLGAYLEINFHCPSVDQLEPFLAEINRARSEIRSNLRASAIKVYLDGAMGSEGAWLSTPYEQSTRRGFTLMTNDEFQHVLEHSWQAGVPVATHCIGDAALNMALTCAHRAKGSGVLHIEHCQMLNPRDVKLLEGLNVHCHFQPSHFLSDRKWLGAKLGARKEWCFPWGQFEASGCSFNFGSDSPIERPSLVSTRRALLEADQDGIRNITRDWKLPHTHPDRSFGEQCWTEVTEEGEVVRVILDGDLVFART